MLSGIGGFSQNKVINKPEMSLEYIARGKREKLHVSQFKTDFVSHLIGKEDNTLALIGQCTLFEFYGPITRIRKNKEVL